jgi:hypothetical protein
MTIRPLNNAVGEIKMNIKQLLIGLLLIGLLAACAPPMSDAAAPLPSPSTEAAASTPTVETSTGTQVDHNGLTFTYVPALLGDVNIQDIAATANQALFEQPSPAHTWVGFVPAGIVRDFSNHWQLAWEPYLMVYNLNEFGSFATGDQYARERVAQFQALATKRSSTINDTIPVIPPINAGQIIRAQVQWLDFGSGIGVRFLTQYNQAANPINNEGLVYIFQGITNDGLHGVTAVFPLDAAGLPDGPAMEEPAYTAFIENIEAEMTAVIEHLNAAPDSDFDPSLSQLDALVQSINITPTADDFPVVIEEPQHGQAVASTDIFTAPDGRETMDSLQAGDPVIINGTSVDGRYSRILCPDGTTGSCWVDVETLTLATSTEGPVFYTGNMPEEGAIVGITAVSDNAIYDGPGETYQPVGELLTGESVSVFGADEMGQWLAIECPRGIGLACWVVADTAVNEPTAFFAGDGWQDITSDYVNFRVPGTWQITAVEPGMGSVLAEWHLGIPGVESDQSIAFFAVPFAELKPDDIAAEYEILIGNEPGVKWVRRGEGYTSYDYYNAGTADTQAAGAGSFGLHVTVPEDDPDLESILDMVAASIMFNQ